MPNPNRLRCPQCRTRRTDKHLMVLHELKCKRPLCHCLTGATYPHRPGSTPHCVGNALSGMFLALAYGATKEEAEEIAMDIVLHGGAPRAMECPF